jgi:hypothetical protein
LASFAPVAFAQAQSSGARSTVLSTQDYVDQFKTRVLHRDAAPAMP